MKNKLDNFIKTSLDKLYSEEPNLIKIDISDLIEVHNAERSIVFRFGHYMINLLERDEDLRLYQVDAEYNRNLYIIKKNKTYIDFASIASIEYEKPTLLKYITAYGRLLFPGILKVNVKLIDGKRKSYLIRLKYKGYETLPNKYKDLMQYPV